MRLPRIGVFDSGCGGLTVLKELITLLPSSHYVYFADTARLPYGSKSPKIVVRYATRAVHFLEEQGASVLVIACNTASALALDAIIHGTGVPVVGVVEPGAQEATARTRNGRVVVLATAATVGSHAYVRALDRRGITAQEKACPLLVPLVEEGWIEHPVTEQVARIYVSEAFSGDFQTADVLLLGCTHYPLLRGVLRRLIRQDVEIVDSVQPTARRVVGSLAAQYFKAADGQSPQTQIKYFVSDSPAKFADLGSRFLSRRIDNVELVDL